MIAKQPKHTGRCEHRADSKDDKTGRTWAFDVHEIRVRRLHKSLELVPLLFGFLGGVKEIDGERLLLNISRPSVRSISWTVLTMTTKKGEGGERRRRVLWMTANKVSEFESYIQLMTWFPFMDTVGPTYGSGGFCRGDRDGSGTVRDIGMLASTR